MQWTLMPYPVSLKHWENKKNNLRAQQNPQR